MALTTRDMQRLVVKEFGGGLPPGCSKISRYLIPHGLSDFCALSLSSITHRFPLSKILAKAVSNATVGVEVGLVEGLSKTSRIDRRMPLARAPELMWVPNLMGLVTIIKGSRGDREVVLRQVHLYPYAADHLCKHPEETRGRTH